MSAFDYAKDVYASLGVDVEKAMERLADIPVSIHCWQGDDVSGFENSGELSGGIAVTGNYPGRARTPQELRADLDFAFSLIPGTRRLNLHALYAECGDKKTARNELDVSCFSNWLDWAEEKDIALDFNPSYFSHPMAEKGTLASADPAVRKFWVEHGIACRRIAEEFGKRLEKTCVTNHWCPDGSKDTPFDRLAMR
ncbi:MAG: L-rhamnose isomerase, partial [Lentisphaeria bacterium]|nr:L-rhamnose isomerase [Lentisphaeria bacterium]